MTPPHDSQPDCARLRRLLQDQAAALWGPARLPALDATLETTAEAVWRVRQEPLAPPDPEP